MKENSPELFSDLVAVYPTYFSIAVVYYFFFTYNICGMFPEQAEQYLIQMWKVLRKIQTALQAIAQDAPYNRLAISLDNIGKNLAPKMEKFNKGMSYPFMSLALLYSERKFDLH